MAVVPFHAAILPKVSRKNKHTRHYVVAPFHSGSESHRRSRPALKNWLIEQCVQSSCTDLDFSRVSFHDKPVFGVHRCSCDYLAPVSATFMLMVCSVVVAEKSMKPYYVQYCVHNNIDTIRPCCGASICELFFRAPSSCNSSFLIKFA